MEKPFDLGDITNGYFRVDPMDETLRTYTNTYITPIEYDCNNLFVYGLGMKTVWTNFVSTIW